MLRGKCANCRAPISPRYLFVELLTAVLFLVIFLWFGRDQPWVVLPAGLILFREFTVSALREVGASKGIKLPVTLLAKWKTTLQLTALTLELIVAAWGAFSLPDGTPLRDGFEVAAHGLFWLAALVTLITGAQYWEQTRKALV